MQVVKVPSEIVYTNISNFDEKQCISVETISVTSNFDGYSEVNQLKKVANILATFFSISTFKTIRINQNDSYELFRIQNQLLRFHLFSRYRKSYLSRLITGAQYYEGGTLEEMAQNGFLQLGLSDMKFIRWDVSIIHRHDIRIAFYGESQLIECLGILI